MSPTDLVLIITTVTTSIVVIIKAWADRERHQLERHAAEVQDLKAAGKHDALVAGTEKIVKSVDQVQKQTNGATDKLHAQIAELVRADAQHKADALQQREMITALKDMVATLKTPRTGRATDSVPPPDPIPKATP